MRGSYLVNQLSYSPFGQTDLKRDSYKSAPNNCWSIHSFLGQASVIQLGLTLDIRRSVKYVWMVWANFGGFHLHKFTEGWVMGRLVAMQQRATCRTEMQG